MKLDQEPVVIERAKPVKKSLNFGVGNAALVLETLRKNMYSDPIRSLVQEIGCNARDANVEAGRQDRPIVIKLPTAFEPTLEISDCGVGISPERAELIYTQFGMSTKRDTNDQLGKFGYGSKVPWAYSDAFTVVTRSVDDVYEDEQGEVTYSQLVERHWLAYIDESKLGKLDLLTTNPLDKGETGTTISVAVKPSDASRFKEVVKELFRYWKVKPEIKGDSSFKWDDEEVVLSGKNWRLDRNCHETKIVLDGIPYPVNVSMFTRNSAFNSRTHTIDNLIRDGVVIFIDGGEIPVTASREAIDYREGVVDKIRSHCSNIVNEVEQNQQKEIDKCKTYWEAVTKQKAILQSVPYYLRTKDLEWNGKKLCNGAINAGSSFYFNVYFPDASNKTGFSKSRGTCHYYHIDDKTAVILNDEPVAPRQRIKTLIDQGVTKVILVCYYNRQNNTETREDGWKKLVDQYQLNELKWCDKLSNIDRTKFTTQKNTSGKKVQFFPVKIVDKDGYEKEDQVDLENLDNPWIQSHYNEYYLDVERTASAHLFSVTSLIDVKRLAEFLDTEIYVISARVINKVPDSAPSLAKLIKKKYEEKAKKIGGFAYAIPYFQDYPHSGYYNYHTKICYSNITDIMDKNELTNKQALEILEYFETRNKYEKDIKEMEKVKGLLQGCEIAKLDDLKIERPKVFDAMDQLLERKPLLKTCMKFASYISESDKKNISHYVND